MRSTRRRYGRLDFRVTGLSKLLEPLARGEQRCSLNLCIASRVESNLFERCADLGIRCLRELPQALSVRASLNHLDLLIARCREGSKLERSIDLGVMVVRRP